MKELFHNQDFIEYIKKNESLRDYNLNNNGGGRNNCYVISLMHMITTYMFKIKENENLTKEEKEKFLSELLCEYEIVSLSMENFLKTNNKNQNNNKVLRIKDDFEKEVKSFANGFNDYENLKQKYKINFDNNDDMCKKISEILSKFFYYYLAFVRSSSYKDQNFSQDFEVLEDRLGVFFWGDKDIFSGIKDFKILNNIFNLDHLEGNGIMLSTSTNKEHRYYKNYPNTKFKNPLLFEQYNSNDKHFTCKVLMTPDEYASYKAFLENLQEYINGIGTEQFNDVIPYNFKNKDFFSKLDLTSYIQ
jgi:hypothetical protein